MVVSHLYRSSVKTTYWQVRMRVFDGRRFVSISIFLYRQHLFCNAVCILRMTTYVSSKSLVFRIELKVSRIACTLLMLNTTSITVTNCGQLNSTWFITKQIMVIKQVYVVFYKGPNAYKTYNCRLLIQFRYFRKSLGEIKTSRVWLAI